MKDFDSSFNEIFKNALTYWFWPFQFTVLLALSIVSMLYAYDLDDRGVPVSMRVSIPTVFTAMAITWVWMGKSVADSFGALAIKNTYIISAAVYLALPVFVGFRLIYQYITNG